MNRRDLIVIRHLLTDSNFLRDSYLNKCEKTSFQPDDYMAIERFTSIAYCSEMVILELERLIDKKEQSNGAFSEKE